MKNKKKVGRPTKYDEKMIRQAGLLCARHGYTNQQLADFFHVDVSTIYNWKRVHPDFFEALKVSKEVADSLVERSLFERATGYECPEDKVFNNNGEALVVPTTKVYPPDTTACIFWLKNRKPEEWREEKDTGNSELAEALRDVISSKPG